MAALMIFTVAFAGIRLKVRLLSTIAEVHREYRGAIKTRIRDGKIVHAFFQPTTSPAAQYIGTIVLPVDGRLDELIPHEVTHACLHKFVGVHRTDDEMLATAVGILSARIRRRIEVAHV
jgi:hypothetical protein